MKGSRLWISHLIFKEVVPKAKQTPCYRIAVLYSVTGTLFHLPLLPHMCINELGQHWFREWHAASSVPSHYLSQCWLIVNWTLTNKLQWNSNESKKLFIHQNAFENVICEMSAILSRKRWVRWESCLQSQPWELYVAQHHLRQHCKMKTKNGCKGNIFRQVYPRLTCSQTDPGFFHLSSTVYFFAVNHYMKLAVHLFFSNFVLNHNVFALITILW